MNEVRITLVYRRIILFATELTPRRHGIPISRYYTRTITNRHAEFGQPVYARDGPVRCAFGFVMLREATAGFSAARNLSERVMELCCIGSALISTSKNGNRQSSTLRRDNGSRIWVAGHSARRVSTTGLRSCFGFTVWIQAASRRP